MVKMKQTAHGGTARWVGMQAAMFGEEPVEGQFAGVAVDEDKENWLDLDAPRKSTEVGESSKSTGTEGDKPVLQAQEPPVQAEGGATANPPAGSDKTATAPRQDPTDEPQDLQAGTSAD